MLPNYDFTDELLDQSVLSIQESRTLESLPPSLVAATQMAMDRELAIERDTLNMASWKVVLRRNPIRLNAWAVWSVAASIMIVASIVALQWNTGSQAFAAVLQNIRAANTVQLKVSSQFAGSRSIQGIMLMDDTHVRVEYFDSKLVMIADLATRKAITFDKTQSAGQFTEVSEMVTAMTSPIELLRNAKPDDAKSIGYETIGGRSTAVYQIKQGSLLGARGIPDLRIWVDRETQLPVKIVAQDTDPKAEMRLVFDEIQWETPIDRSTFDVAMPNGFRSVDNLVIQTDKRGASPAQTATAASGATLISGDRVPRSIVWSSGNRITSIVTDPESVKPQNSQPSEFRQWDAKTRTRLVSKTVAGSSHLSGSNDGKLLAYSIGREVQVFADGNLESPQRFVAKLPLPSVALSPTGNLLAAGSADWNASRDSKSPAGCIEIWNVGNEKKLQTIMDESIVVFVEISPNDESVVSTSNSGAVKLWNIANGELLHQFEGAMRAAYSPDGKELAVATYRGQGETGQVSIDIYRLDDYQLLRSLPMASVKSSLLSIAYSRSGSHLAAGSWDGQMMVWKIDQAEAKSTTFKLSSGVHTIAFSPDGKQLATGSEDGALQIWSLP